MDWDQKYESRLKKTIGLCSFTNTETNIRKNKILLANLVDLGATREMDYIFNPKNLLPI